jgi:GcrA cell cycle regulator
MSFWHSTWSDDRVAKLGALLAGGYSASQAAAVMGCTRNSIIGIAHRKKLAFASACGRPKATGPRAVTLRRKAPFRPTVPRISNYGNRLSVVEVVAPAPLPATEDTIEVPLTQRRSLLELKDYHCRWPYGDVGSADFYFCGGHAIEATPYCLHHCRMGYRRPGRVEVAA